jgi:diaminopimelate epimerase
VLIKFTKMHGCGNDFILIDDRAEELDLSEDAVAWLCDRHFGIGADGIMLVRRASSDRADFAWWFRNADGSVAEMCGNGIRCFAKYAVDHGLLEADQDEMSVETDVGILRVQVTRDYEGRLYAATVDMGAPILEAAAIPTTLSDENDRAVSVHLDLGGTTVELTCVSMGNPHAIVWVDDVDEAPVESLGPAIEGHEAFPRKTNVEFAQIRADGSIDLRVWERGVGETLACGTGACATVVAAALTGRGGRQAVVSLPGGELAINWTGEDDDGPVLMTGPAVEVFSGELSVPEDDDLGD